jgi:hypothetical protein
MGMFSDTLDQILREASKYSNGRTTNNGEWLWVQCPLGHTHDHYNHAQLHTERGYIYCWGKHGYIPVQEVCEHWGIAFEADAPSERRITSRPIPPAPAKQPVYYDPIWEQWLQDDPRAQVLRDWLPTRGINAWTAIGWRLGYTGDDTNLPPYARHKLSIPWVESGTVKAVKLRALPNQTSTHKYISLKNSDFSGFFNLQVGGDTYTRVIFETELDAIALSAMVGCGHLAIACPANQLNSIKMGLLAGYDVYIALDQDEAGEKTLAKARGFNPNILPLYPLEGQKDFGAGLPRLPVWAIDLIYQKWESAQASNLPYNDIEGHFEWDEWGEKDEEEIDDEA